MMACANDRGNAAATASFLQVMQDGIRKQCQPPELGRPIARTALILLPVEKELQRKPRTQHEPQCAVTEAPPSDAAQMPVSLRESCRQLYHAAAGVRFAYKMHSKSWHAAAKLCQTSQTCLDRRCIVPSPQLGLHVTNVPTFQHVQSRPSTTCHYEKAAEHADASSGRMPRCHFCWLLKRSGLVTSPGLTLPELVHAVASAATTVAGSHSSAEQDGLTIGFSTFFMAMATTAMHLYPEASTVAGIEQLADTLLAAKPRQACTTDEVSADEASFNELQQQPVPEALLSEAHVAFACDQHHRRWLHALFTAYSSPAAASCNASKPAVEAIDPQTISGKQLVRCLRDLSIVPKKMTTKQALQLAAQAHAASMPGSRQHAATSPHDLQLDFEQLLDFTALCACHVEAQPSETQCSGSRAGQDADVPGAYSTEAKRLWVSKLQVRVEWQESIVRCHWSLHACAVKEHLLPSKGCLHVLLRRCISKACAHQTVTPASLLSVSQMQSEARSPSASSAAAVSKRKARSAAGNLGTRTASAWGCGQIAESPLLDAVLQRKRAGTLRRRVPAEGAATVCQANSTSGCTSGGNSTMRPPAGDMGQLASSASCAANAAHAMLQALQHKDVVPGAEVMQLSGGLDKALAARLVPEVSITRLQLHVCRQICRICFAW